MLTNQRPVLLGQRLRHHRDLLSALEVFERRRLVVGELDFRGIEHVEHDHVVAAEPERGDRFEHRLRILVEVRDEHEEAAPREVLRQLPHRRRQLAGLRRLQPIEDVQRGLHVLRRRRHVLDDVVVEGGEPDAVALPVDHVGQAGGEDAAVIQLRDAPAAEGHGLRDVQQAGEVGVGVRLVLLYIKPIGAPEQLPVHAPDVVPRRVAAVLGEIDGCAEVRQSVHPVDEPLDDHPRDQLEVADAREDHGVHEPRPANHSALNVVTHYLCGGVRPAAPPYTVARGDPIAPLRSRGSLAVARSHRPCHIPDRGMGTASRSLSTSASLVTPSDCAWKFVSTRCRRIGCASARTSSKLT